MKQYSILPEGLSEETLGAYLEGSLDVEQEVEVEQMLDRWDELQGFVNDLADDAVAGEAEVDPSELPSEADFVLPYVSGLDDLVVVDDMDSDADFTVIEIDDWNTDDWNSDDSTDYAARDPETTGLYDGMGEAESDDSDTFGHDDTDPSSDLASF